MLPSKVPLSGTKSRPLSFGFIVCENVKTGKNKKTEKTMKVMNPPLFIMLLLLVP
jgi:hypothetical protein